MKQIRIRQGATGRLGAAMLAIVLLAGCASTGSSPATRPDAADGLVLMWPEPPQTPRIKTVGTYSSEASLGREQSFGESFSRWLTGAKPPVTHVYQPMDLVVSDDGQRVYVADFGQMRVHLFDLEARTVTPVAPGRNLNFPFGVALDAEENLYVVEQSTRQVVVMNRDQQVIQVIAHPSLVRPADIALDRERERIYVADPARQATEKHTVKVFDFEGDLLTEIGAGRGNCDGCLNFPTYVEVGSGGLVYVTSTINARVDIFDADLNYLRSIGARGDTFGSFGKPKGVALDSFGNLYVVDSEWSTVQIFNETGEVLLYFGGRGSYPGLLHNPTGIAIDRQNRIYVADYLNYRVTSYELVNTTAADSFLDPTAQADPTNQEGESPSDQAAPSNQPPAPSPDGAPEGKQTTETTGGGQ